jgi:hypothetical protein
MKPMDEIVENRVVAIMQPYIFPYLGYFHLLEACDDFVFYDDVQFIKSGWINRNQILNHGKPLLFSIPVRKSDMSGPIKDVGCLMNSHWLNKFKKQLHQCYSKAPFYRDVSDLVESVLNEEVGNISDLAINSVTSIYHYLGKELKYDKSSVIFPDTLGIGRVQRINHIVRHYGASRYVNPAGGSALYSYEEFRESGIDLKFLVSTFPEYHQLKHSFVPSLSIIDILMFNSPCDVLKMLKSYSLK